MEPLARWLAPNDWAWFLETHFAAAPYARPGTARDDVPLCGWSTFDEVLGCEGADVLTVAGGRLVEAPRPRSVADMRRLMSLGVSVVVRASERHDVGLRTLAASFERILAGEVHIQLYATPAGTNSYGWHYDFEDVFIVQTAGAKDYTFRANTVARDTHLGELLDFELVQRETSPRFATRLLAGDWLYLPSRWWHFVRCVEDSLSISVGVMPPAAFQAARRVPAGWSGPSRVTPPR